MSVLTEVERPHAAVAYEDGRRWRALAVLVAPTLRLLPLWHLLAGSAIASAAVWHVRGDVHATVDSVSSGLRLAAVPLVLAAGFVFDDPTEDALSGTPCPVSARRWLRALPTIAVVSLTWWGMMAWAESSPAMRAFLERSAAGRVPEGSLVPRAALSIEVGAMLLVVFAVSAFGVRLSADRSGGIAATAALLAGLVVAHLLPARWALILPSSASPQAWHGAHVRWAWIGAIAFVALLHAVRDPGRLRLLPRVRRIARRSAS